MKRSITIVCLLLFFAVGKGQNCIDAIIFTIDNGRENTLDTMYCKILSEDEYSYTIDNGYAISSLTKNVVKEVKICVREMTVGEIYRYKGLDQVTQDYFNNSNTAGAYFRKAAFSAYLGLGLSVAGTASIVVGATVFDTNKSKNPWIITGSVVTAVGIFFIFRAWNQIYKAGKIMDINNAALYFDTTPEGNMGLLLKF